MNRQAARALNTGSKKWARLRQVVLLRDQYRCKHCLRYGNHVDHIDNNAHNNDLNNLQVLCVSCHSAKTATEMAGKVSKPRKVIGPDGAPEGW